MQHYLELAVVLVIVGVAALYVGRRLFGPKGGDCGCGCGGRCPSAGGCTGAPGGICEHMPGQDDGQGKE